MEQILQNIWLVLLIATTGISLLVTTITLINKRRIKKMVENGDSTEKITELQDANEKLTAINRLIQTIIPNAIQVAEEVGGSGEYKKLIATSKIIQDCDLEDIEYKQYANMVSETIEEMINLSKKVNNKNSIKVNRNV